MFQHRRCIIKNQDLLPTTPWTELLQNDFWGTPLSHSGSHKSYRPLCIFSFRINYMVGGLNPVGYHLMNVVLHAVVSCLFVHFCSRLFKGDEDLALFGGLFFALHPIHTGICLIFGIYNRILLNHMSLLKHSNNRTIYRTLTLFRAIKNLENWNFP